VSGQLAQFISPDHPTIDQYSQGQRYFVKPKVGLDLKTSSAYFKPEVAWHTRQYTLSRLSAPLQSTGAHKQQTVGIPIHTLDMGLFLERQLGSQSIQTLEPRLFYLYVPNINQNNLPTFDSTLYSFNYQQLFRDNRFSGLDRQSDAHQLAFGTTSRLKHKDSGREYAQINIGQLYYFTSAHVSLCDPNSTPGCRTIENPFADAKASSVVTELLAHINPALSVRAEGQFNPSLHRIAAVTTSLQYHHPHLPQKLFNIEYNFLKEGNIQYDLEGNRLYPVNDPHNDLSTLVSSFKLPLALHWTGIAYWNFALKGQLTQEVFSGVEYNQCCFALRMGFHRQLRLRNNSMSPKNYDNIASIQFALKGLGQLGTDPGMRLKENIHGFRETLSVF
jgi:LPS-assembly protein